jgi:hypothetical protein
MGVVTLSAGCAKVMIFAPAGQADMAEVMTFVETVAELPGLASPGTMQ